MAAPIQELRGFNSCQVSWKTDTWARGEFWYPKNLEVVKGDADPQTYEEWCTALENAGVNLIRLKPSGRNKPSSVTACSLEPPPEGTYNIWHSALDPSNLTTYRSDQVTHPVNSTTWANSNLGQLCVAAENHGIKFNVAPFENQEWRGSNWDYHAWNSANKYVDGNNCEAQDQGFIANARDLFTNSTAIAAAKARIQFLIDVFAAYDVIGYWEICAELTWLCTDYAFWGEAGWNAAMISNIRDDMVPWVSEMATYIKANDSSGAPVAGGQVRTRNNEAAWDADPDHMMNVVNEIHQVPELDFVLTNWYLNGDFDRAIAKLRLCQEKFDADPGIPTYIEQYWPFAHGAVPSDENAPYLESKMHEWILVCSSPGAIGPCRWPGIEEIAVNNWATGGYADPDLHSIAGVSETFCDYAKWSDWDDDNDEDFESYVSASGITRHVAWGDGRHVAMMIDFDSGGSKTVTITNLVNGSYTLYVFNWVTGVLDSTQGPEASGGSLSFSHTASFTNNVLVAYLRYNLVTPEAAVATAASVAPSVGIGLSVTPSPSTSIAAAVSPGVAAPVLVAPPAAATNAILIAPGVVLGGLTTIPSSAIAVTVAIAPTVEEDGELNITPAVAIAAAMLVAPGVILGALDVIPVNAAADAALVAPSVILGMLSIAPGSAVAAAAGIAPTVILGGISITPSVAMAQAAAVAPSVILSSLVISPTSATIVATVVAPSVSVGQVPGAIAPLHIFTAILRAWMFLSRKRMFAFATPYRQYTFTARERNMTTIYQVVGSILVQPNTSGIGPFAFKLGRQLPPGNNISSVVVKSYLGATETTEHLISGAPTVANNVVSVYFKYPGESRHGEHKVTFIYTLAGGEVDEADFFMVRVASS